MSTEQSKHTPGDWKVTRGAGGDPFSIESGTRTIAHVKTCRGEAEANAHIIAAAPCAYTALRNALAAMQSVYDQTDAGNMVMDEIEEVRAIIARIEGRN